MAHANTANRQIRKGALPCGSVAVWQQALQAQPAREEVFTTIGEQPCGPVDRSTVGEVEWFSVGGSVDVELQPVVVADGMRPGQVDEEHAVQLRHDGATSSVPQTVASTLFG